MTPAFVGLLVADPSTAMMERWIREAVAGHDVLPALAAAQAAAVATLGLTDEAAVASWASRARWRALLPRLDARFGTSQSVDVRAGANIGNDYVKDGRGLGADVAARWTLGDLVFSDLEMRINRERLARSAAVRLARERVTQVWFQRLEVLIRRRTSTDPKLAVEAARLDGLLYALTGGRLAKAQGVKR